MLVHRPAIYEHAAALIGCQPAQAVRDIDLLAKAHLAAAQRYSLNHVVVGMDIYGCDADAWFQAAGLPRDPQSPQPTLADVASAVDRSMGILPMSESPSVPGSPDTGRMPVPLKMPAGGQQCIIQAAARLRAELPGSVQVRIPVTGPFSIAAQIVGFEGLLLGLLDDPAAAEAALDRLAEGIEDYVRAAGAALPPGCGVTFFESAASPPLVRPADFQRLVLPRLARLMAVARRAGESPLPPELILGGPTAPILPLLLKLNPALVLCDPPNDPAIYLARCREAGVALRVNIEPRLRLPEHRIEAHQRLEALARIARGDEPLYVATGVIPFDADPQTVLDFTDLVEQVNQAV